MPSHNIRKRCASLFLQNENAPDLPLAFASLFFFTRVQYEWNSTHIYERAQ